MRLSVIIPVYNGEGFIERCLESVVKALDFEQDEIIIVDDASTDKTFEVCQKYVKQYPDRIKVCQLKTVSGPSKARNEGLLYAEGEVISFIDGDDYIAIDMYRKMLKTMFETKADMVCCGYYQVEKYKSKKYNLSKPIMMSSEDCLKSVLNCNIIGDYVWNKLYRKNILREIMFPVGELYEDISTMCKIMERCERIYVIPDVLYYYIKRVNSLTYHPNEEKLKQEYRVSRMRNEFIGKNHPGLRRDIIINNLKLDIFIYSRMAKLYSWKECGGLYGDIRQNVIKSKKLLKYLPVKYWILGMMIIYMPSIHGGLMYGKR